MPGVVRARRLSGQVGHLVMWDSPYQVVKELRQFLQNYLALRDSGLQTELGKMLLPGPPATRRKHQ